jgi:hypothetical protein
MKFKSTMKVALPFITGMSGISIGGFIAYRLGLRKGRTLCRLGGGTSVTPVSYQYVPVSQPIIQPAPIQTQSFVAPPMTRTMPAPNVGTTVVNTSNKIPVPPAPTIQPKRFRRPNVLGNQEVKQLIFL